MKILTARYLEDINYKKRGLVFAKILFGLLWMTLASQICVPLPFHIPITLGPQAAIFLGMILGPRYGTLSLMSYIALGAMGAPVFAGWRPFLSGPTVGYLIGYIPAAWCMGWAMQRMPLPTAFKAFCAALFSHIPLYACGLMWLVPFVGWDNVLSVGLFPFLPGLFIKTAALTGSVHKIKQVYAVK